MVIAAVSLLTAIFLRGYAAFVLKEQGTRKVDRWVWAFLAVSLVSLLVASRL